MPVSSEEGQRNDWRGGCGHHYAAVLGDPIQHSLSPVLHDNGFRAAGLENWSYERIRCPKGELKSTINSVGPEYEGFSVTMPGKFEALNFAAEATQRARLIGSANTLVKMPSAAAGKPSTDGISGPTQWRADNTDGEGVKGSVQELLTTDTSSSSGDDSRLVAVTNAVIVGNGGTARPALWALAQLGCRSVTVVARSSRAEQLRPLAEKLGVEFSWTMFEHSGRVCANADVLVSTVPSAAAEPYVELLAEASAVCDVIYSPWPTPLISHCLAVGTPCVGGTTMLFYQSLSQFEQFTGHQAPQAAMRQALEKASGVPVGVLDAPGSAS
ncbi:shikimate dehydrogenase [Corynebacterium sp. 23_3061]|uniref:shikimate dehydrogenase n=1 Tax=Corynebacterium kroppenstedtii TaxID=161879 RepID=UPI0023B8101F|nr:shikimate dehydrogenase [Corynebacterium kroppenstedtii]MDN8623504.1 shikimate dehydrogenase [Corynebacterium kroppenstedtii]